MEWYVSWGASINKSDRRIIMDNKVFVYEKEAGGTLCFLGRNFVAAEQNSTDLSIVDITLVKDGIKLNFYIRVEIDKLVDDLCKKLPE